MLFVCHNLQHVWLRCESSHLMFYYSNIHKVCIEKVHYRDNNYRWWTCPNLGQQVMYQILRKYLLAGSLTLYIDGKKARSFNSWGAACWCLSLLSDQSWPCCLNTSQPMTNAGMRGLSPHQVSFQMSCYYICVKFMMKKIRKYKSTKYWGYQFNPMSEK